MSCNIHDGWAEASKGSQQEDKSWLHNQGEFTHSYYVCSVHDGKSQQCRDRILTRLSLSSVLKHLTNYTEHLFDGL